MSIFKKIIILFFVSIVLIGYLATVTNKIANEKIELANKEKYIQATKELFDLFSSENTILFNKKINELHYKKANISLKKNAKIIYERKISFGLIQVLKKDKNFYLYMKYFGDTVLLQDKSDGSDSEKIEQINYLFLGNVFLLIVMLMIVLKMLTPLKQISKAIEKFGRGDYSWRLKKTKGVDEVSQVVNEFNNMASNLELLIKTRAQFLNDISHELRMPIAKAKISLEMIEDTKYKKILKKSIQQMDDLTNELLELEKIKSKNLKLNRQTCTVETLLSETLSRMMIENEEDISIDILNNFECFVDINYMSIAIKNLIDNALKYKTKGKVEIKCDKNTIEIKNQSEPLKQEFGFYTREFTQEDNSRGSKGYGLGLNLVSRIVNYHGFEFTHRYENSKNIFGIKRPLRSGLFKL
ncbi:MAG: ArsS family sensor histidine kinase [Campylobacteraceae bacterium]|nr:ArsS family sensor histidine kinase [Campylobacteraceae bacterium]